MNRVELTIVQDGRSLQGRFRQRDGVWEPDVIELTDGSRLLRRAPVAP